LRVALDATPLLGTPTGVGTFVAGALAALARRDDLDLSAYALSLRGRADLADRLPPRVRPLVRPMPAGALMRVWAMADVAPAAWWTGPVDVVHGTNFVVPPAPRTGAVVTVHDLTPVRFPELSSPATAAFPTLVRRAVARGAWVHTPSAFVAGEVIDLLGVDPDRVVAVHHGIPPSEDGGPSPVEGPYLLALGTIEPRKNLPALVRAFDALAAVHPDLSLVVAGPDGWGSDAFAAAVAAAHHGDRIRRFGWVSGGDKAALLRGAAVYAYPSRYEGFGFPPLEAMAVGVPVVAGSAGALPEVLGDGAFLVEPDDPDALAEAIEQVLTDATVRDGLVERGRRRVAEFDWARCAAGLADLYRRAAG
jgi:glycosyltransferase involved in cell wall biosynthesis